MLPYPLNIITWYPLYNDVVFKIKPRADSLRVLCGCLCVSVLTNIFTQCSHNQYVQFSRKDKKRKSTRRTDERAIFHHLEFYYSSGRNITSRGLIRKYKGRYNYLAGTLKNRQHRCPRMSDHFFSWAIEKPIVVSITDRRCQRNKTHRMNDGPWRSYVQKGETLSLCRLENRRNATRQLVANEHCLWVSVPRLNNSMTS